MARWLSRPGEHDQVAALLSTYLDGRTSEAERALVERHLHSCADCKRDLATLRATITAVRALSVPPLRAPRSFALPRSMAKQARPFPWLVPTLRGATALVTLLFVIAVAGDALLRGPMFTASAPMPVPASIAREAAATSAPPAASKAAPLAPQTAQPSFDQAASSAPTPVAEAARTLATTPVEPPVEQPLTGGGMGGGASQTPGLGGGQPPSAAPLAPALSAAPLATNSVTPTTMIAKAAGVAPTATQPQASATPAASAAQVAPTAAPTAAPPTPTALRLPTSIARAAEPQPPVVAQQEAKPRIAPPIINSLRIVEVVLAALATMLGAATWIAHRRGR